MKGEDDAYLGGLEAELLGDAVLEAANVLAGLPDGDLVAFPGDGGLEELERIVVLGGRFVPCVHGGGCSREALGQVADGEFQFAQRFGFHLLCAGAAERGRGVLGFVPDVDEVGGGLGLLDRFSDDDGDDLTVEVDLRRGERRHGVRHVAAVGECFAGLDGLADVLPGEDFQYAGNGAGGGLVD